MQKFDWKLYFKLHFVEAWNFNSNFLYSRLGSYSSFSLDTALIVDAIDVALRISDTYSSINSDWWHWERLLHSYCSDPNSIQQRIPMMTSPLIASTLERIWSVALRQNIDARIDSSPDLNTCRISRFHLIIKQPCCEINCGSSVMPHDAHPGFAYHFIYTIGALHCPIIAFHQPAATASRAPFSQVGNTRIRPLKCAKTIDRNRSKADNLMLTLNRLLLIDLNGEKTMLPTYENEKSVSLHSVPGCGRRYIEAP